MYVFTKIKQSAEHQTAVEQPLSKERREILELQIAVPDTEEETFF